MDCVVNQPSRHGHPVVDQTFTENHRNIEISNDLQIKFYQKSDFLAVMRLFNTENSQSHVRPAWQVVSCIILSDGGVL